MRNIPKILAGASAAVALIVGLALSPTVYAGAGDKGEMPSKKACAAAMKAGTDKVAMGGCIATDRKGGNCHACHFFKGLETTRLQAGNIAPPFIQLGSRFSKQQLKDRIYDPMKANPNTSMPPFGKHHILNGKEIDLVVEWLVTL
jgi:sulfur-oxidizing protein SoxX